MGPSIRCGHHCGADVFERAHASHARHQPFVGAFIHHARRDIFVRFFERSQYLREGQAVRRQALGIDDHLKLFLAAANRGHLRNAAHGQQTAPD
jgi:hypothetical protein